MSVGRFCLVCVRPNSIKSTLFGGVLLGADFKIRNTWDTYCRFM
jgi:hypothetical protein